MAPALSSGLPKKPSALTDREGTEADESHGIAFFQGFGDHFDDGIDGAGGGGFRQVGLFGYGSNKVSFIHFYKSPNAIIRENVEIKSRSSRNLTISPKH